MRVFFLFLLFGGTCWTQPKIPIIPQPIGLLPITRSSGMIFSGTVLRVDRAAGPTAATQITFRVEHAIRGVRTRQIIQISEWGGLWQTGERYSTGEQVLLFLYPKSKLGLTSPVGGKSGRFEVDSAGRVLIPASPMAAPKPISIETIKAQIIRSLQE